MDSGNGSKHFTPCRSFGLKRINKKAQSTPGTSSGSGVTKSVNSPFTSPLITTRAATDIIVQKKGLFLQDSLWSTPIVNKTSLKMGLSKSSGKTFKRVLQPKDLLNNVTPKRSLEEIRDSALSKKSCGTSSKSDAITNTLQENNLEGNPESLHSNCVGSENFTVSEKPQKSCSNNWVNGSFVGWDSDNVESASLNDKLKTFRKFLKKQGVTEVPKPVALYPSNPSCSCHNFSIFDAKITSKNASVIHNCSSSNKNFRENGADLYRNLDGVAGSVVCDPLWYNKADLENLLVYQTNYPTLTPSDEDINRHASKDSTMFHSYMEDEYEYKWDLATSYRPELRTYPVKYNENRRLSVEENSALTISKRLKKNQMYGSSTDCVQTITLADNKYPRERQILSKLGYENADFNIDTKEVEQLKTEIQKWLEGGQRVIQMIIEEVYCQKDRKMTVMEVLKEQGVDPDLVGYDPEREEFMTFDKVMVKTTSADSYKPTCC